MTTGTGQSAAFAAGPIEAQAVRIHDWGGPDALRNERISVQPPAEDEVLLKVVAAGVNPVDWKICSGAFKSVVSLPFVPGNDVAGIVQEVGAKVNEFRPGDQVFSFIGMGGGYAEYATVKAANVAKKPGSIDMATAAGVPVAAITAWQALFKMGNLEANQRILVHAAAGGVGGFAVQFAHNAGAYVIGTASVKNTDYLKSIEASEIIDYQSKRFEDILKDIDFVLDLVGGDTQERSWQVLRRGGTMISAVQPPSEARAKSLGITAKMIRARPDGRLLSQIASMIDEGKVKVDIATTLPLKDAVQAQKQSQSGRTRGKIVLFVAY